MNTKAIEEKIILGDKIFVSLFFLYAVLGSNNLTYGKGIITPVMLLSLILGAGLIIYRLCHVRAYSKMTGFIPCILMLASISISTLANYRYSLKENIVFCIYWSFFFFLLYFVSDSATPEKAGSNAEYIGTLFVIYITAAVGVSFYMLFAGTAENITTSDGNYDFYRGFAIGRLWGIFINPNNSAVSAAMTIILLLYFFKKYKNVLWKILSVLDMAMLIFFIALTDSRTGAVSLGLAVFFYTLTTLLFKRHEKQGNPAIAGLCILLVLSLAAGFFGYAIPRKTKDLYNRANAYIVGERQRKFEESERQKFLEEGFSPEEIDRIIEEKLENEDFGLNIIERGYDIKTDVSNRRIDAWKSATEIFLSSPKVFVLGTSFGGFTQYAIDNLPQTYIVNNDYGLFTTLDNEVFNIMDAQGIFGLVCLVILVADILIVLFKNLLKVKDEYRHIVAALTGICFGLAGAAMFSSVMFYHFSQNSILFWVGLGSLMYIVKNGVAYED